MAKKRALAAPAGLNYTKSSSATSALSKRFSWGDAVLYASIFAAVFLAYFPALQGGLLWDDSSHITRPELQPRHGLWRIWTDLTATQQYYPLLHSAFWIEHRIWGDAVLGYHLTNIALHATAACLVAMIGRRLSLPGARLAAFVFALHPVCVEAVAWISEQKSTLSAVFYLSSALVYLQFNTTRKRSQYGLAAAAFVLAVLTKTVTATLPAALLVVLWWKNGRVGWKRDVMPLVPWFAFGASAGLFTAWVEWRFIGARGSAFELTFLQRLLLAGRVLCFYAAKVVWPVNLIFTYPHWSVDARVGWQYLFPAAVIAIEIGLWFLARRFRGPLAGSLFFCGTLFPVLGFLNVYPFRFSYVADHFQYLASLGIILPAASGLVLLTRRLSSGASLIPAMLVLILGVLSWRQSGIYTDDETLYRSTLARNPNSWMAHHNLAKVLAERPGGLPEAIEEYQASLRIYPDFAETHNNLGNALAKIPGRLLDAARELEIATRLDPGYAHGHYNLANVLVRIPGRLPEAVAEYQAALRIDPNLAEAHHNLGIALSQMPGRLSDAIREYQAALRIEPGLAEAHNDLGKALSETPGRTADGLAECYEAIRINPNLPAAYNNLGMILAQMPERLPDAIAAYQSALRIAPDYAQAHNNLGSALAQSGHLPEAVAEFRIALQLNPAFADARANLESALILSAHPAARH
jgi:protein O-mannosyl-transferase